MSRTIKFRAWTGKRMLYQEKQYLGSFIRRVVMQIMLDHNIDGPMEHESYLPKGSTLDDYLQQFTGLLDCRGKEIYEGDIVRSDNNNAPHVVLWDKDGYWLQNARAKSGIMGIDNEHCEVIGNIHETRDEVQP